MAFKSSMACSAALWEGAKAIVVPRLHRLRVIKLAPREKRHYGWFFARTYTTRIETDLQLPPGYRWQPPKVMRCKTKISTYEDRPDPRAEGRIRSTRVFTLSGNRLTKKGYDPWRRLCVEVDRHEAQPLMLGK